MKTETHKAVVNLTEEDYALVQETLPEKVEVVEDTAKDKPFKLSQSFKVKVPETNDEATAIAEEHLGGLVKVIAAAWVTAARNPLAASMRPASQSVKAKLEAENATLKAQSRELSEAVAAGDTERVAQLIAEMNADS